MVQSLPPLLPPFPFPLPTPRLQVHRREAAGAGAQQQRLGQLPGQRRPARAARRPAAWDVRPGAKEKHRKRQPRNPPNQPQPSAPTKATNKEIDPSQPGCPSNVGRGTSQGGFLAFIGVPYAWNKQGHRKEGVFLSERESHMFAMCVVSKRQATSLEVFYFDEP